MISARCFGVWVISILLASFAPVSAQPTLDKIDKSGVLIIGTRTGSPPFAYVNKNNEWVGFSIELVEKAVLPALAKKLNKQIRLEKKESAPQTRIPLLSSNAVDLIAETMAASSITSSILYSTIRLSPSVTRSLRLPH